MERLSLKKKLHTIRLYYDGLSYDEIASRTGVGKGSVSNVIAELKAGKFPEYADLSGQLETLRELAIDLKRTRLTLGQAAVGVSVLARLQELEVEPSEIEGLSALYRTLNIEGLDIHTFLSVGLTLTEVQMSTGLSLDELEMKAKDLEESVSHLGPVAEEVTELEAQLIELDAQSDSLLGEVAGLEEHQKILEKNVRGKEQREGELSKRVRDLEDRAQSADERLAAARKDLMLLSETGMSQDNLSAFAQRLKVVAQRRGIQSEVLRSKLMDMLEQLDEGSGLEMIVKTKKQELRRIEAAILKAKEESAALMGTNEKLRQESSGLRAALLEERRHIVKDIKAINVVAQSTVARLSQDLSSGIRKSVTEVSKLSDQALRLGRKLGQFNEMIASNSWLKGLQALVKGDEEVEANQVRAILMTVMKALLAWLDGHSQEKGVPILLKPTVNNLIGELERWKV